MVRPLTLSAIGTVVRVRFRGVDEAAAESISRAWAWTLADAGAVPDLEVDAVLRAGSGHGDARGPETAPSPRVVASTVEELADRLTGLVTREAIGMRRDDLLMLHAGAVADGGRAVAFLGPSGRGKTTASIALGRRLSYLTDETTAVADDLTVLAYPKPLSVKVPGETWKRQEPPSRLSLQAPPLDAPVLSALLILDRDAGHRGAPIVEEVPLAEAVEELVPQISYLPARDRPLRRLASVVDACGGLRRVRYREADTLVPTVRALLDSPPQPVVVDRSPSSAPCGLAAGPIRRGAVDDAIGDGARLIVLRDGVVSVLDGIAPVLWEAAEDGVDLASLTRRVVRVHGEPEGMDADALVRSAVDALLSDGLLVSDGARDRAAVSS